MMPRIDRRTLLCGLGLLGMAPATATAAAPPRIASLDYGLAETLLALGVAPIAVAGARDWHRWVVEPELPDAVADLGSPLAVNLELLSLLEPDLILSTDFVQRQEPALARIAETRRITLYEEGAVPLDRAREAALTLGGMLSREAAAEALLAKADRFFDACRERAGRLTVPPLLFVSFLDSRHARVYGGTGLYQSVLDRLGLPNAWQGETNYWGFATIGLEQLATNEEVHLIAIEPMDADVRLALAASPLWTRLPFVEAGKFSTLPPVMMFGALPSAMRFARLLVDHLEDLAA